MANNSIWLTDWDGRQASIDRVCIIAEIGVNHNGDSELARRMIGEAAACGVDCVKFQTFKAERVATADAPKAAYQKQSTDPGESQLAMLRALELAESAYEDLIRTCRDEGVLFLSTPFSVADARFLQGLGVDAMKIGSGQAVELMLLEQVGAMGMPVLLSTGMCALEEVRQAVHCLRASGTERLVVLQCTTQYPSSVCDANLRAMVAMGEQLQVPVGYSDHTSSLTAAVVSVGLGACVVERHFTLDRTQAGPDHACSSDPRQMRELVRLVREAESALGDGIKRPCASEWLNMSDVRRGYVAAGPICAGEVLGVENLALKRPTGQLNGLDWPKLKGRRLNTDVDPDTPITPALLAEEEPEV